MESFCAGPEAPGDILREFFLACQKEPPQTPKRKSPGGAWRQVERRRNRMTLPIAGRALGLTARRCQVGIDTGGAGAAGLRPEAERAPRGCGPSTFRKLAPARKRQRAAGDAGCYSTTAYLQPPGYSGMCFLWGSTPVSFPHRERNGVELPCAGPSPARIRRRNWAGLIPIPAPIW